MHIQLLNHSLQHMMIRLRRDTHYQLALAGESVAEAAPRAAARGSPTLLRYMSAATMPSSRGWGTIQ